MEEGFVEPALAHAVKQSFLMGLQPLDQRKINPACTSHTSRALRGGCSTLLVARAASTVQRVSLTLIGARRNETRLPARGRRATQIKLQHIP